MYKAVDLLLASSVLNTNYKLRKIHRNICKDNCLLAANEQIDILGFYIYTWKK